MTLTLCAAACHLCFSKCVFKYPVIVSCILGQADEDSSLNMPRPPNISIIIVHVNILTETKYGPAKSQITPVEVQMPMWPMKGKSHLKEYNKQKELTKAHCLKI